MVNTGGSRFGIIIALPKVEEVYFSTFFSIAPVLRCRCQSSGFRIIMFWIELCIFYDWSQRCIREHVSLGYFFIEAIAKKCSVTKENFWLTKSRVCIRIIYPYLYFIRVNMQRYLFSVFTSCCYPLKFCIFLCFIFRRFEKYFPTKTNKATFFLAF